MQKDIKEAGSISGLRRSPEGGHDNPTPVFLPEEFYGQRSLEAMVHRITQSQTRLKQLSCPPGSLADSLSLNHQRRPPRAVVINKPMD